MIKTVTQKRKLKEMLSYSPWYNQGKPMMNLKTFVVLCTTLIILSACVSNPRRPLAPLCGSGGDCISSEGDTVEDSRTLLCTTPLGYSAYETYIDGLELRIRQLERSIKEENQR